MADDDAALDLLDTGDAEVAERTAPTRDRTASGWRRVFTRNRAIWVTAGVALAALIAGLVIGRFVISPIDQAVGAGAPEPGLVTVPVEYGELRNDVTVRADIGYSDPVPVKVGAGGGEGAAIVTGQVPEPGAQLNTRDIALEVGGRPVIVLPGELPSYRNLRVGASGPDVKQLKEALGAAGIDPGDAGSDIFDAALAGAISELYAQVGYSVPEGDEGAGEALVSAEDQVRSAEDALEAARASGGGAPESAKVAADNAIANIERQIWTAEHATPRDQNAIDALYGDLHVARLQRQELDQAPPGEGGSSIASAERALESARSSLTRAQEAAMPTLPSAEVLFLTDLPRRVDTVNVTRGQTIDGDAMTVSGATLAMTATAAEADARLLKADMRASFDLPDGNTQEATVKAVVAPQNSDRWKIELEPAELTNDQINELQGTNVRVSIPVGATDGEVLSVPFAALSAGPGGESRIEVVTGDPRDGDSAERRLVTVETGLAADGHVEVRPVGGELAEGDLVVIAS